MADTVIREIDSTYDVQLLMAKNGIGITGQSPTIEIRRLSDQYYLDHSAVAPPYFVNSGGQKEKIMAPVPWLGGLYNYIFNPAAVGVSGKTQFTLVMRNIDPLHSVLVAEHIIYEGQKLEIDQTLNIVANLFKTTVNRLKIDKVANTLTYYDDDQITPLYVFDLFDVNGMPNWKNILERVPQ